MRRARHFRVTGFLLDQIFTARPRGDDLFMGITSDAPEDMHITGIAGYDPKADEWTFVAESAVFDEVPEGAATELFVPTFTAHYGGGMTRNYFTRFRGWLYDNGDTLALAVIAALLAAWATAMWRD
jgi:hypothetical protein